MYTNDMFSRIYYHFENKISPRLGEQMFFLSIARSGYSPPQMVLSH